MAIDGKYEAIILGNEHFTDIYPGDKFKGRIKRIYEDGIIGITNRKKRLDEREMLKESIVSYLLENDGYMPFNDKSAPELIKETFQMTARFFHISKDSAGFQGESAYFQDLLRSSEYRLPIKLVFFGRILPAN